MNNNQSSQICCFVIGVTGTGKSNIIKLIEEEHDDKQFNKLLIDDFVTMNTNYKKQVNNIISFINSQNNNNTITKKIKEKTLNNNYFNSFEKSYWKTRTVSGCTKNNQSINKLTNNNGSCKHRNSSKYLSKLTNKKSEAGCSKEFNNIFYNSICKKTSIIYENVGRSYNSFSWAFPYLKDYTIIIYFSFCNNMKKLYNRNINRGIINTLEYLKNKNKNPAPRFAKMNMDTLIKTYLNYLETVKDTIIKVRHHNSIEPNNKIKIKLYNTNVNKGEPPNEIIIDDNDLKLIEINKYIKHIKIQKRQLNAETKYIKRIRE
jgi:hypothetical protein